MIEQPAAAPATDPGVDTHLGISTTQDPATSIAAHAASFGPQASQDEPVSVETPVLPATHPSASQRRTDAGQFDRGRHRATKQQAGAEDVPRIKELTGKWRTAEQENVALKAELEALRRQPASRPAAEAPTRGPEPPSLAAPRAAAASSGDPRPDPKDATKYPDGQFDVQYFEDLSDWKARAVYRTERERETKADTDRRAQATVAESFERRATAATQRYADFEAVVFAETPLPWTPNSSIDQFITDDDESGMDVLYHLRKNPGEVREILAKSPAGQFKALSLLAQRLAPTSASRTPAAATRSAAAPVTQAVPRPPNLVRTGAHSVSDGPPADGRPLSLAEHAKHWGPKAARR